MIDYPSTLDVRPLTTWPGQLTQPYLRKRSPFSAPLKSTLATLDTELLQLRARTPVLEVAIEPGQFRLDGRPRSTARADHPGVVLSLPHTSVGPLRYAADRFETWQDNLRAITLGLEALRRVERYGITRRGEQYAGFKALPAGDEPMDRKAAMKFVWQSAEWTGAEPFDIDVAYRRASKRLHPDAGGSTADFQKLQDAIRILRGEQ